MERISQVVRESSVNLSVTVPRITRKSTRLYCRRMSSGCLILRMARTMKANLRCLLGCFERMICCPVVVGDKCSISLTSSGKDGLESTCPYFNVDRSGQSRARTVRTDPIKCIIYTGRSSVKGLWPGHSHLQLSINHQSVNN